MEQSTHPQHLSELREEVRQLKQSLTELVHKKRAISVAMMCVVESRARVALRRRAYEESKRRLRVEYEELQQVASSNQRRDDRLAKVRGKDFSVKLEQMENECVQQRKEVEERQERLQVTRQQLISALQSSVFPVEVEPLSVDDAGEEDYLEASVIDCDAAIDVADGWVLSGVHRSPTPHITIVTASLPLDGDYSAYTEAAKERRKLLIAAAERGAPLPPVTWPGTHPQFQPYLAVPAGLQFTAQLVECVADLLDTPLPYPLHRHLAILEYCNQNKKKKQFQESVAKLDDNIVYLCFSQNIPLSAVSPGHTLENVLALITHTELGRQGPFECHPELAVYTGNEEDMGDTENEPPSIHMAELPPDRHSGSEGEVEGEEWESVDVRRERGQERGRLDYESSYLDYMSLGNSRGAEGGEGEGKTESSTAGGGLFGTLSSLLSSTFSRSTTNTT